MHEKSTGLPFIRLDPSQIPAEYHFEAWRNSVSPLFNTKPMAGESFHDYRVDASVYLVDSLVVGLSYFTQQHYLRTQRQCADDETDHFVLQIYPAGRCAGSNGNRNFSMDSQTVSLLDLSRPLESYASNSTSLNIVIPREIMREHAGGVDNLHGRTLSTRTSQGALLAGHMYNLWRVLPQATSGEAQGLATATAMLAGALFRTSNLPAEPTSIEVRRATFESLCRFIDRHLLDPNLGIDTLCRHHNLSRSTVYRLFKPQGGIMGYIVQRRLTRSYQMLRHAHGKRVKIIDIAMQCGFSNVSHFNYLFQRTFALTPSEVLHLGKSHPPTPRGYSGSDYMDESRGLAQWFANL